MRSHFSEEIEDTTQFHKNAVHAQPRPGCPPQPNRLGDLAAIAALSIAFCALLLLGLRSPLPPGGTQSQSLELPPRPIWVNNLPYGPRDGLLPDFGQQKR
jgi:hypothetical protein